MMIPDTDTAKRPAPELVNVFTVAIARAYCRKHFIRRI
jgi:hypothetical protein